MAKVGYKTARRLENESKIDEAELAYTENTEVRLRAHLDQTQRNAKPETAVLFAKNQTKGTFAPVTETHFHFKTTFLRAARRVFATKSFGCFLKRKIPHNKALMIACLHA